MISKIGVKMRINVYNQNNVTLRVFFNLKLREK